MDGYKQFFEGDTSHLQWGGGGGNQMDRLLMDALKKQVRGSQVQEHPMGQRIVRELPRPSGPPPSERNNFVDPNKGKKKVFVKPLHGFNMSGAMVKAEPWEQGAAFSHYSDEDPTPNNAAFGATPGFSSGLTPSDEMRMQQAAIQPGGQGGAERSGVDFERDRWAAARQRSDREYDERAAQAQAQQQALRSSYIGG